MNFEDWELVCLEEVAEELTVGFVGSMASEYVEQGIPFFRSLNIEPFRINKQDLKYISKEFHAKLKKSSLHPGDVVIVRTGKPGACLVVPEWVTEANCSDLVIIRPGKKIDSHYLSYYVNSVATGHVNAHLVGAVQQHFNVSSARSMKIMLPSIEEQKAITSILNAINDKIEINNRINKTLEEMAQALFKRWFVDFEFPDENGQPYKSSGGEMEESELGPIPKDWRVISLGEVTSKFATGLNPRKNFKLGQGNNYYVTIKNMGNQQVFLDEKCDKVDDDALTKINKRSDLKVGDLMFSGIGTIGRVYLIADKPANWNISESIFTMRPNADCTSSILYMILLSDKMQDYAKQLASGSVQKGIRMADMKKFKIARPQKQLQNELSDILDSQISLIKAKQREIGESVK